MNEDVFRHGHDRRHDWPPAKNNWTALIAIVAGMAILALCRYCIPWLFHHVPRYLLYVAAALLVAVCIVDLIKFFIVHEPEGVESYRSDWSRRPDGHDDKEVP